MALKNYIVIRAGKENETSQYGTFKVITRKEYDQWMIPPEPITDSDDKEEAERLRKYIEEIGVNAYLKGILEKGRR